MTVQSPIALPLSIVSANASLNFWPSKPSTSLNRVLARVVSTLEASNRARDIARLVAQKRIETHHCGISIVLNERAYFLRLSYDKISLWACNWELSDPCVKRLCETRINYDLFLKKAEKALSAYGGHALDEPGCIYLVSDGSYTKIGGTSYAVTKRLNELQTGNAKKLKLIGFYEVQNKISTESRLHLEYAEKRVLGEWFKLSELDIYKILSERADIINKDRFVTISNEEKENLKASIYWLEREFLQYQEKIVNRLHRTHAYNADEAMCLSIANRYRQIIESPKNSSGSQFDILGVAQSYAVEV